MFYTKGIAIFLAGSLCIALQAEPEGEPSHHWHNHAEVARRVIKKFDSIQTMSGNFRIQVSGSRSRSMSGRFYYMKPNKIRYEFSNPAGNLIVSNGKIMWYYIRRRNIAGRQDLTIQRKNASGRPIFVSGVVSGLRRLFQKYHYHFDTPEQPRLIDGKKSFVLSLKQRTRIGGYERMTLFIDADTYLVYKSIGEDGYGKKSTITFSNIRLNKTLEGKLFQYRPKSQVRVVSNPFVKDDKDTSNE